MPSVTEKNIFEDVFSSGLSQFKKYHHSGNLKYNNLGIFRSFKLRNLMGEILRISLRLNFTPNVLWAVMGLYFTHEKFGFKYERTRPILLGL